MPAPGLMAGRHAPAAGSTASNIYKALFQQYCRGQPNANPIAHKNSPLWRPRYRPAKRLETRGWQAGPTGLCFWVWFI